MIYINLGKYENYPEIPIEQRDESCGYINFDEKFIPITEQIVPNVCDWYMISNYGRIYHKYLGIFMKPYMRGGQNSDYCYIVLRLKDKSYKSIAIHRLVLASFYPSLGGIDNNMDVNHKNGVKTYNYISYNDHNRGNLEWSTRKDNVIHAYNSGLNHSGEDNSKSKITNETALKVIQLLSTNNYKINDIVEIVGNGVTASIVEDIRKKNLGDNFRQIALSIVGLVDYLPKMISIIFVDILKIIPKEQKQ